MTWRGTPGPWKADRNHGCRRISAAPYPHSKDRQHSRQAKRYEVACTPGLYDDAEDQANADGIAAVPHLVEALLAVCADAMMIDGDYSRCDLCQSSQWTGKRHEHIEGCALVAVNAALRAAKVLS